MNQVPRIGVLSVGEISISHGAKSLLNGKLNIDSTGSSISTGMLLFRHCCMLKPSPPSPSIKVGANEGASDEDVGMVVGAILVLVPVGDTDGDGEGGSVDAVGSGV